MLIVVKGSTNKKTLGQKHEEVKKSPWRYMGEKLSRQREQ